MRLLALTLFALSTISIFAQSEFKDHGNGLIYHIAEVKALLPAYLKHLEY